MSAMIFFATLLHDFKIALMKKNQGVENVKLLAMKKAIGKG
jgi:hypothetical protein